MKIDDGPGLRAMQIDLTVKWMRGRNPNRPNRL
jgi:hypothetical protein